MALQLPPKPGERVSQILPTVKCSTCGAPVALIELTDHICPPLPPQTPSTPRPSALLAKIRQASQAITVPGNNRSSSTPPVVPRSMTPLSVRSKTPQPPASMNANAGTGPIIPPPKTPSPSPSLSGRRRSSSVSRGAPMLPPPQIPPPPVPTTPNQFTGPGSGPPSRVGTPQSAAAMASRTGVQRFDTFPRGASPLTPTELARHPTEGSRRPSVASFADARPRVPSAPDRPVLPPLMTGSANGNLSRPGPGSARPSMEGTRIGGGAGAFGLPTPLTPTTMSRPPEAPVENMAGVGRRGFQAAAQAAMLASSWSRGNTPQVPTPGMDGRRTNAPRHLNINADMLQRQSSASLSPNTPLSSHSPRSPSPHSPHAFPPPSIASSRTPSPTSVLFPGLPRVLSPKSPDTVTVTGDDDRAPTPQNTRLSVSSRYNKKELAINIAARHPGTTPAPPSNDVPVPPSPSDSDYSGSGLAYDQDTESGSVVSPTSAPTTLPSSSSKETVKQQSRSSSSKVQFPSLGGLSGGGGESSPASSAAGLPTRSASSASSYSYASRSTARSTGALDTLFEGVGVGVSDGGGPTPLSPSPESPKLPTRSRTTPAMSSSSKALAHSGETEAGGRNRPKQCTRCAKRIDDGRWVRAESAGVLCERCWKTMYLPKCRRCNRPIEKQAVSSADGQLKGKYHRECFNCHKCQQPFPDKEFYVFDGKPFCRYHYHEANDSLCADPACGQPIEGACAVAHTGERYHPEHLLCEYAFPPGSDDDDDDDDDGPSPASGDNGNGKSQRRRKRCMERLEEYWEVEGRMLCEKHANVVRPVLEEEEEGEGEEKRNIVEAAVRDALRELGVVTSVPAPVPVPVSAPMLSDAEVKAHRRKTQFIDLR